jgi:hypothetical protein
MTPTDDLQRRLQRLEDTQVITQLRARYCQLLDDGRWDDLVELFTPDGEFVGLSTARGHAELRTFFARLQEGSLSAWWHFSSNETIELEGDRATGQTWLLQPCVVDGQSQLAAGRYVDTMARGDDGIWRFVRREVRFFWWVDLQTGWDRDRFTYAAGLTAADAAPQRP